MSICSVISILNRLSLNSSTKLGLLSRGIATNNVLLFKTTPALLAEPLKKKKRMDPAITRAREERKKRKLEKQIRKLEKNAKTLKPIDECEIPQILIEEKLRRARHVKAPEDVTEKRILLEKKWSAFKQQQHLADVQMVDRLLFAQQKALDELRKESEDLYQAAIQFDEALLPFNSEGPTETPPIEGYDGPDGDYKDVSKIW